MLREVDLRHFKAFERFTLNLNGDAYLIGPNNAGKSTLIAAIRGTARMLRVARARNPTVARRDGSRLIRAFALSGERLGVVEENIRHEFRLAESRLRVKFDGGASITAVWPAVSSEDDSNSDLDDDEEGAEPFFYLEIEGGRQVRPAEVRAAFPVVGIIPALTPVEMAEEVRGDEYVREQSEGRLLSRHFRNHLRMLDDEGALADFLAFAAPWVPEVELHRLETRTGTQGQFLDFYYTDIGRRTLKEVSWAGDGMQVWFQLLLHVFRLRNVDVLVLDEPDLYLHADLQRRLVRLLGEVSPQTVTATHSPEMIGEAAAESIIWIDKSRRRGVRNPRSDTLASLSQTIGTQFNLRLAKALRSRAALFVEGKDMQILSILARTLGLERLAAESGVAVVPLGGFSNWEHVEPFKWLVDNFLERSVKVRVVLDSDYRPHSEAVAVVKKLGDIGILGHVWKRKELESYLLESAAICRAGGIEEDSVHELLEEASQELRGITFSRSLAEALRTKPRAQSMETATERFDAAFSETWADLDKRLRIVPPKDLLSSLNSRQQENERPSLDAKKLARALRRSEIDSEMVDLLRAVEEDLA